MIAGSKSKEPNYAYQWNLCYQKARKDIEEHGDGLGRNAAITRSYHRISQADPIVTWFAAAALGSSQVGDTLRLVNWRAISWMPSNEEINASFCFINQEIHHTIVAFYKFHIKYGNDGLETLRQQQNNQGEITEDLVKGMRKYDKLRSAYQGLCRDSLGEVRTVASNDWRVIGEFFSDELNVEKAYKASMAMTRHEQTMVQNWYFESACNTMTLGQALQHSWIENYVTDMLKWGGPIIDGRYFSTTQVQWTDLEERIKYFDGIFKHLSQIIKASPDFTILNRLLEQADPINPKPPNHVTQPASTLLWQYENHPVPSQRQTQETTDTLLERMSQLRLSVD